MSDGGFGLSITSYNIGGGNNNIERNYQEVIDYRQISLYR